MRRLLQHTERQRQRLRLTERLTAQAKRRLSVSVSPSPSPTASVSVPTYLHEEVTPWQRFMLTRDWESVSSYWRTLLLRDQASWPSFVTGEGADGQRPVYGLADMQLLYKAGDRGEFHSKDSRYENRQTFAMRIGYAGDAYFGYQWQKNINTKHSPADSKESVIHGRTVEGDLSDILRMTWFCAGRTDRGVHALSQVVCCATSNMQLSSTEVMEKCMESDAWKTGRLRIFDCVRVPKRFHARSSALWRRYLYLFPLNTALKNKDLQIEDFMIDLKRLNEILYQLKGKHLPFYAFTTKDDPRTGNGLKDKSTLLEAKAYKVELLNGEPVICVELVGTRFLRQMVRILVGTALRESSNGTTSQFNQAILEDICLSGDRNRAERALPPNGLCFAGVGYDHDDLSFYKYMPKQKITELQLELLHRK